MTSLNFWTVLCTPGPAPSSRFSVIRLSSLNPWPLPLKALKLYTDDPLCIFLSLQKSKTQLNCGRP